MTARIATKPLKDAANQTFLQPVIDISGTGAGPFLPMVTLSSPDGTHGPDLEVLLGGLGTRTDAATLSDSADGSLIAMAKRQLATLSQIAAALSANTTPLTSLNSGIAGTTTAVTAVTSAVNALQALTSAGNATEASILAATTTLQTTLAAVQALELAGNASLSALHSDDIDLKAIGTTGNAALAAIQTSTSLGATAANQAVAKTALDALNATAASQLTKLTDIAASITALGSSLGGGKSLADIALMLNPKATSTNITDLQTALSGFEASEIALLTDVKALLTQLLAASNQPSTAVTPAGVFPVTVANQPADPATNTVLTQILAALTANTTAIGQVNTSVASTTAAVSAVASATNDLKSLTSAGNATEAQVLAATNTLQTTLAAVQTLDTAGNAALSALHSDEINLQAIVTTGNAALAAIQTSTSLGATAANQAAAKMALDTLNATAASQLTKLTEITTSITALGATLGGGKSLNDVVLAVNSTAKGTEIAALSTIINTNETTEIAKLTALEALLTSINTYASQASTPVTIAGTLSVNVANQQATQAVFAANLPLPTGASTEITLAALSAKLGVLGQKLAAGSAPVVIASDQPALPVTLAGVATDLSIQQLRADIQAPTPAGTYTIGNVGLINRFTIDVAASTTIVQTGFIDIPLGSGQSLAATIKVTAVSGTLPTLDLILQEAMDDDDTFQDIYHMERIIGIGTFRVPTMQMHGRRRWKYVIGGTTPSFTFGITVTRSMGVAPIIRRFFVYNHKTDVSGNNATGASASATPSFNIEGCKFITLAAKVKYNATTPGAVTGLIFQVSEDNLFFGTFGSNFSITSSTTPNTDTLSSANYTSYGAMTKFIRAITSSSAAGNTCDYVVIKASN